MRFTLISACTALVFASAVASAQTPTSNNGSDVSGPPVTTSDAAGGTFQPDPPSAGANSGSTTTTLETPQAQAAVANLATTISNQLSTGTMTSLTGGNISGSAQTVVYQVITGTQNSAAVTTVTNTLTTALTTAGTTGGSTAAVEAVPALLLSLAGLVSNPGQLPSAIGSLNEIIQNAPESFIKNPPAEFVAIQQTLAMLSAAASNYQAAGQ